MAFSLDFDTDAVFRFVKTRIPGLARADGMRAIGVRNSGGDLVGGAVYEGFNGQNIWGHVAGAQGRYWLTRDFLRASMAYPFLVCGARSMRTYVEASNAESVRLNERLGFRVEARLEGAACDGGDVLIFVMRREECRFLMLEKL